MPKYDYACKTCEAAFEIERGMHEAAEGTLCPHCASAEVRRIYAGIALGGTERSERAAAPSCDMQAVAQGGCQGCAHHHH